MTPTGIANGTQKAAIVLMNMEPSRAALVMAQLSDIEAEEITAEIVRLKRVDPSVAEQALAEFHQLSQVLSPQRGGRDFATELLEASFGSERAATVMNRVASSLAGHAFEFLDAVEPSGVATLLVGELPQTIAVVLAHLRADQAAAVIQQLDDSTRTEVAHAIATLGRASADGMRLVADGLKAAMGSTPAQRDGSDALGGVGPLVDIINVSDTETERGLLAGLDARDPALAAEVRAGLLGFEDLPRFDARSVQSVLRGIDIAVIALALHGGSEEIVVTVSANLSERNRELLSDETAALRSVRPAQVDEARSRVVRSLRALNATGALVIREVGGSDGE